MNAAAFPDWMRPPAPALPPFMQALQQPAPDLTEAARLIGAGFHVIKLVNGTKRPEGDEWNNPSNYAKHIDPSATGYGLPLASNGLVSIDPDNAGPAAKGLIALGFDLEALMQAGVRTRSTRPGSGGRSIFKAPAGGGLAWLKFSSKVASIGTVLELRATSTNLQDVVPGVVYRDKSGAWCQQHYAGQRRIDDAPELPPDFLNWWHRCSTDLEYFRSQQELFFKAIGVPGNLATSGTDAGGKVQLAFESKAHRSDFNSTHAVPDILRCHGYKEHRGQRWEHPAATGQPGIREIPGKNGLWRSDHGGDPLTGTFDAWNAYVILDHDGDLSAAQRAFDAERAAFTAGLFPNLGPVEPVGTAGAGSRARYEFMDELPAVPVVPDELVEGLLTSESIAMFFGDSNSGKTFCAVELEACVSEGRDFLGRKVQQGVVVHVAAEAAGSVRTRFAALAKHRGAKPSNVALVPFTPDLFGSDADTSTLIETIRAIEAKRGKVRLITLDTLAACSGGASENTSEMAAIMRRIERIKTELKACVLVIHHIGKNSAAGARGWSGIRAALDTEIEVVDNGGVRVLTVTKQRDLPKGQTLTFGLEVVHLGTTNFGQVASSCVVIPCATPAQRVATPAQALEHEILTRIKTRAAAGELTTLTDVRDARLAGVEKTLKAVNGLIKQGLLTEDRIDGAVFGDTRAKTCLFIFGTDKTAAMLAQARLTASRQLTGRNADRIAAAIESLEQIQKTGRANLSDFFSGGAGLNESGP